MTCLHGSSLSPHAARYKKDYSTVLSRDAVAKTFPSVAQAPSQIIRACDLSTATGTYPAATSQGPPLWILMNYIEVRTGLFSAEQAPGSVTRDGEDELVVRTERDACHGKGVAFEWLTEGSEGFRLVDPN